MGRHWDLMRRYYPQLPELPDPETTDDSWRPEDPDAFFGPIAELNAWGKIQPEEFRGTLLRIYKRLEYEKKRDRVRARDEERAKRRFPPSNCRREGNKVLWDPPNVTGGEEPQCYWVEHDFGGWTTLQPPIYPHEPLEKVVPGNGDAKVVAYYPDEPRSLGWGYRRGPVLERRNPETRKSVSDAAQEVTPTPTPETPPKPAENISRIALIAEKCQTYTGPRLKRGGAPYLRQLRKWAGIPDITSRERFDAHRLATKGGSS